MLTAYHLGEGGDRVEGRPQLVHELAERIRWEIGAEDGVRRGLGPGYLVDARPAGAAPIAQEAPGRRIEKGHAGDAPVARCGAGPGYLEPGVAERRPFPEGAGGLAVATEMALLGDRSEEHTSELQSLMRISYAG